jgi:hypothetical protein
MTGTSSVGLFQKSELQGDEAREEAEMRIYCDNDARWTLAPADPSDKTPNSHEKKDRQKWNDDKNKIQFRGLPGCKDRRVLGFRKKDILAEVYNTASGSRTVPIYTNAQDENGWRSTMTICDNWLKSSKRVTLLKSVPRSRDLSWFKKDKDKDMRTLDALAMAGSGLMLHELTHHTRYNSRSFPIQTSGDANLYTALDKGYGYKKCYGMKVDTAVKNADSYEFFGILMWSLGRGYALDPDNLKNGGLKKDSSIPVLNLASTVPKRFVSCADVGERNGTEGLVCKDFEG